MVVLLPLPVVHAVRASLPVADLVQPLVAHPTRLDHEEDRGRVLDHRAEHGQRKCPAHVVVLPVRHPVSPVAASSEDDDRNEATGGGEEKQGALGEQQHDVEVVVVGHQQEGGHQEAADHAERKADGEEELDGDEERGQQEVVNHHVLVVKDPAAAVKGLVVEVVRLYKVVEANLP